MKANSIKITALQWYAGVAEDMRNKLFLKIITPMEYYEKLTEALETAMKQEKEYDNSKLTRFEVIDENGRAYTKRDCNVELSYQDDGRTLKVFIKPLNKQDNEHI